MNQQEPDPHIVILRLDQLARSCGWIDRFDMRKSVLKARGLTPSQFSSMRMKSLIGTYHALKAKYASR